MPTSREGRVLLWGARMDPDAPVPHDLEEVDWTALVQLALDHRVTPLLHASLKGVPGVPAELIEALGIYARMIERSGRELLWTLRGLLRALGESGVQAVPFKGPVLAAQAYSEPALRVSGDLDLLLRPDDLDACHAVLEALGFEERYRAASARESRARIRYHACTEWICPANSVVVEPHWRIVPWTLAADLDTDGLLGRAVSVEVSGKSLPSLCLEDQMVILSLHGAKHEWSELRWICDLAGLLRRHPGLDLETVFDRAREVGCLRAVLVGLALARDCLHAPVSGPMDVDPRAVRQAADHADALFCARRGFPPLFEVQRSWLAARERRRDRYRYVWRTLFTPRVQHVRMIDLPRWLEWCYPLVKAGHDYVALPAWSLFKRGRKRGSASASEA